MSQSLTKIYTHIVFRTKNSEFKISEDIQKELHAYMATVLKNIDSPAIIIGGEKDHIHILCSLSKNISISKLVEDVKKTSSKWIKPKHSNLSKFSWQNGYCAFSVSQSQIQIVKTYISNQKEHHKKVLFKDEVLAFLDKYEVEYDEKYLWN